MSELVLNIDEGSLDGYLIGDSVSKEFTDGHLKNHDKGYAVHASEDTISSIYVYFEPGYANFNSFRGMLMCDGKIFHIDKSSNLDNIISVFGEPKNQWDDGVEKCAEFFIGQNEIEVLWNVSKHGMLEYISIESTNFDVDS